MADGEKRSFLLGADGGHVRLKSPDKRPHGEGITLNGSGLITVWGPRTVTKYRPDPKYIDPKQSHVGQMDKPKKFSFFSRHDPVQNNKPIPLIETVETREVVVTPAQIKEMYVTIWEEGLVTREEVMELLAKINRYSPKGTGHPEGIPETEADAEDDEGDDETDTTS